MRRDSITTLQDLDERGHEVRAWCWACGRGAVTFSIIWQKFDAKGWPQDLASAASRFTCSQCGSSADAASRLADAVAERRQREAEIRAKKRVPTKRPNLRLIGTPKQ